MNNKPAQYTNNTKYQDFRLESSKKTSEYNVMKFQTTKKVDLKSFTPPIKLYRKETLVDDTEVELQPTSSSTGYTQTNLPNQPPNPATIAPYGGAMRNKQMLFKKRTKQIYLDDDEQTKQMKQKESRPWVLEDDDGQNSWKGGLEGSQQSSYMIFLFTKDGFKVIPIDKWYKFTPKLQYSTLSLDEAELELQKVQKLNDRWIMKKRLNKLDQEDGQGGASQDSSASKRNHLRVVDEGFFIEGDDDDDSSHPGKSGKAKRRSTKHGDEDEVDFEEIFEDDEEMPMENDTFEEIRPQKPAKKPKVIQDDTESSSSEDEAITLSKEGKQVKKLIMGDRGEESDEEKDPYADSDDEALDEELDEDKPGAKDSAQAEEKKSSLQLKRKEPATPHPSLASSKKKPSTSTLNSPSVQKVSSQSKLGSSSPALSQEKKKRKEEEKRPAPASRPLSRSPSLSPPPASRPATSPRPASPPSGSPPHTSIAPSSPSEQPNTGSTSTRSPESFASEPGILRQEEIIEIIRQKKLTTSQFISIIKPRLKMNPNNKNILSALVRKVAKTVDKYLVLKDEYRT